MLTKMQEIGFRGEVQEEFIGFLKCEAKVAEETLHRVTASRPRGRSPFKPWPAEVRGRKKKTTNQ